MEIFLSFGTMTGIGSDIGRLDICLPEAGCLLEEDCVGINGGARRFGSRNRQHLRRCM